jgi:hypothetical protein
MSEINTSNPPSTGSHHPSAMPTEVNVEGRPEILLGDAGDYLAGLNLDWNEYHCTRGESASVAPNYRDDHHGTLATPATKPACHIPIVRGNTFLYTRQAGT